MLFLYFQRIFLLTVFNRDLIKKVYLRITFFLTLNTFTVILLLNHRSGGEVLKPGLGSAEGLGMQMSVVD